MCAVSEVYAVQTVYNRVHYAHFIIEVMGALRKLMESSYISRFLRFVREATEHTKDTYAQEP